MLIAAKIGVLLSGAPYDFPLTAVALVAAVPVLLHRRRVHIVRKIDWGTLVFFASMFVFMQSVWDSGFFQGLMGRMSLAPVSTDVIFLVSISISQLISNVPLVALYLPVLMAAGAATPAAAWRSAAGSTIAGNLFILGAASNVIIIQNAENKAGVTVTFWEFARIGIPLTAVNVLVYRLFLG